SDFALDVLDREAELLEALLEVVGEQWRSHEILAGRGGFLLPRRLDGLVELVRLEGSAADPGERNETCLLVLIQSIDEPDQLRPGRIVRAAFENVVGLALGAASLVRNMRRDLGIVLTSPDNDIGDLLRCDFEHRGTPSVL